MAKSQKDVFEERLIKLPIPLKDLAYAALSSAGISQPLDFSQLQLAIEAAIKIENQVKRDEALFRFTYIFDITPHGSFTYRNNKEFLELLIRAFSQIRDDQLRSHAFSTVQQHYSIE